MKIYELVILAQKRMDQIHLVIEKLITDFVVEVNMICNNMAEQHHLCLKVSSLNYSTVSLVSFLFLLQF